MVTKENFQITRVGIIISLVLGIAVWAYLEGVLTPSLAANLVEIAAEASGDIAN